MSVCKNGRVTRNEEREREGVREILRGGEERKENRRAATMYHALYVVDLLFFIFSFLFISTFLSFSLSLVNARAYAAAFSFSLSLLSLSLFFLTSSPCPDSSSNKKRKNESSFLRLLNDSRRLLMLMIHPFFLRCISLMSLKCVCLSLSLSSSPSFFAHQLFTEYFISSSSSSLSSACCDW